MKYKYPLVIVEWDDAYATSFWRDNDELDKIANGNSFECINVGWMIRETKKCILLASRWSPNDEQFGLVERLPRKMIKSIKRL